VRSAAQLANPPARPLLLYDGDCNFCVRWIRRWRGIAGERVDYLPFQEPSVPRRFPELHRQQLETAVHFLQPDGSVFTGAEAALRSLGENPRQRWLLDWYVQSSVFARTSERLYRFVAEHRGFFSLLTRLGWGERTEIPTHFLVRWTFLRALALIYLIAFVSLWVQVSGLLGSDGIAPARMTMENVSGQVSGLEGFHVFPTLCWFNATDASLQLQCAAGTVLALLLLIGFAPVLCLFLLWLIYLSLCTIGREFLSFQWDILLLETGFLALFIAPLQLLPRLWRAPPPSKVGLWLLRWLLFRLMFESGCVKLLSGDPTWHNLTALNVHYETQPLPTWIGWYAHQLPGWFQKTATVVMFVIELGVPFLIFAPRRPRFLAGVGLVGLQVLILLTGNYCFFNLLTLALCLTLLDDAAVVSLLRRCGIKMRGRVADVEIGSGDTESDRPSSVKSTTEGRQSVRGWRWPGEVTVPVGCLILLFSMLQLAEMFRWGGAEPALLRGLYNWVMPFRTVNSYGLFAVMTTNRLEIIVQGSNDGTNWLDYEFKYKPGDVQRRPRFVAPHQPRLDWQMWFAALGNYRGNPWFVNFCVRLLQNSPEVVKLLRHNPFPQVPPRYIRAVVYEYHFTDLAARRKTGAWWRREFKGGYLPVISLTQ